MITHNNVYPERCVNMIKWRFTNLCLIVLVMLCIRVDSVFACSTIPTIADMRDGAELVVIGTITSTKDSVAVLQIEEYWKGASNETQLKINNHMFSTTDDCRLQLGQGNRFAVGSHIVAFLQKDEFNVGAEWRPTGLNGLYALTVIDDQVWYVQESMGTVQQVRSIVLGNELPLETVTHTMQPPTHPVHTTTSTTTIPLPMPSIIATATHQAPTPMPSVSAAGTASPLSQQAQHSTAGSSILPILALSSVICLIGMLAIRRKK
jgi:hypothetical protein